MDKKAFVFMFATAVAAVAGAKEPKTEQLENFIKNCIEFSAENSLDPKMEGPQFNWEFTGKYKVVYADKSFFSYYCEELAYTGGAHGNFTVSVGSMFRNSGRKITLRSIAPAIQMQKKLLQLISLETSRIFKCNVSELSKKLLAMPELTENFYLDNKGITFVYNEYKIAGKGTGVIKVFIPYTEFPVNIK